MAHSTYLPEKMGTARVSPSGRFEAGSYQEFTVTYRAGLFGMETVTGLEIIAASGIYISDAQGMADRAPTFFNQVIKDTVHGFCHRDIKRPCDPAKGA